ncbi:hypothetical protein GW17_00061509 [Ensete ventricosum]|nr:hypothetical protein GW17_00061509 [Ensete ventricosum]
MRLNHVESFYAFLLCFCSEGSEEEEQPATTIPHARPATHGKAGCKGQPVAAKTPCKVAAGHSQSPLQGRLQGLVARCEATRGSSAARAAACKGGRSCRGSARARWHRPPARYRPRAAVPPPAQGSGGGATH